MPNLIKDKVLMGDRFFDTIERISHFDGFGRTYKVILLNNEFFLSKETRKQPENIFIIVLLNVVRVVFFPFTLLAFVFKCLNRIGLRGIDIRGPINELPYEMFQKTISYLNEKEIGICKQVCKKWDLQIIKHQDDNGLSKMIKGRVSWEKRYGTIKFFYRIINGSF